MILERVNSMRHELKTWPLYFEAVANGSKTFEIRKNDRDFKADDVLVMCEYEPARQIYTGNFLTCRVVDVFPLGKIMMDVYGIRFPPESNLVIMSIDSVDASEAGL